MEEQKNPKERNPEMQPAATQTGWKRLLNYQSIVKQVPFFLFLALLAVLYIYNGHYAEKTIRNINRTAREVKELQYEYISLKGEVLFRSRQSELVKAVEPMGLKELASAPVVLEDSLGTN
jgi:hypothetical protein